jgi:hypothetical protein
MTRAWLLVLAACGGAAQRPAADAPDDDALPRGTAPAPEAAPEAAPAPAPAPEAAPAPAPEAVTPEAICDAIARLRDDGCGFLERYEVSRKICVADHERGLRERQARTDAFGRCYIDAPDCETAARCIDDAMVRLGS